MSQLDKCPFCGSTKVDLTSIAKNQYAKRHIKYQGICHKCYARGPIVTAILDPRHESQADIQRKMTDAQDQATQLWNQRHVTDYSDFDSCK